jgi:photosystem II stability/assembly factor-like uncharacterized protein
MKNIACYILLSLLALISKPTFSQNFWEVVPTPDTANPWTITIAKNGDIFSGSNGVYLSHDQGQTWEFKGIYGKTIYSMAVDSLNNIFAGVSCRIYKSTDYGENWYEVLYALGNMVSLTASSNGLMLACFGTYIGYLLRSTDYGETWDTTFTFPGSYEFVNDILIAPSGDIYFATTAYMGGGGGVYVSKDNGQNLRHIGLLYHMVQALAMNSQGQLFAASYGQYYTGIGGCYRYNETDSTWTDLTVNLNAMGIVINSNDDIYLGISNAVGGPGGIFRSLDNGETWHWLNAGLSGNSIDGVWLSPDQYVYALTYASHTLNKSIDPTVTIINNSLKISDISIFPNPFEEAFYLKIPPDKNYSKGSLSIYDTKGTIVKIVNLNQKSVTSLIKIDSRDWQPGIYCYYLSLDNSYQSGKILKIN